MEDIFSLKGKNAVVLGGAGGLGEAIAEGLSQYGANLIIASRKLDALEKAAIDIKAKTGGEVTPMIVDVTDERSMAKLVGDVVTKFGTVDILVNAMGLNIKRDALDYPMEDWEKIFNINVKGTMIACKHFGSIMKEQGKGKIINLSSVREVRGYTGGNSAYCATKGAVGMITKALALELAPYNIHVNAIGPSLIITQGTIHIQKDPTLAQKYSAQIPLGRLGVPEDMKGVAVFLASSASNFITGQTIFIDGGLTAG
ncbi:MAG: glucose 1-dehydrogenase [Deltaproteobacteria bacterium]|nr:glucose 1-dehydrogenase [Deltaproteobacteria bacterium]